MDKIMQLALEMIEADIDRETYNVARAARMMQLARYEAESWSDELARADAARANATYRLNVLRVQARES